MTSSFRNLVIEASAGTGKTYCVENLVARLVLEERIPIEKILAVTFTEKATAELNSRVRERLYAARKSALPDSPEFALAEKAVEDFDSSAIFTIHGFCKRVLDRFAFENAAAFDLSLENDRAVYDRLFSALLREKWREDFLPAMDQALRRKFSQNDFYRQTIVSLAAEATVLKDADDETGDMLIPFAPTCPDREKELADMFRRLSELLGQVPDIAESCGFFHRYFDQLKPGRDPKGYLKDTVTGLLSLVRVFQNDAPEPGSLLAETENWFDSIRVTNLKGSRNQRSFEGLLPPGAKNPEACPELKEIISVLNRLNPLVGYPEAFWISRAARELKAQADDHKRRNGILDFNDMLTLVLRSLKSAAGEKLVSALRAQYACALVDEFQDTDPVQWEIFKIIFADSPAHRLIVVGDPKQAIYSFRGANIQTYFAATQTLTQARAADRESLKRNWRSLPPLVETLNRVFAGGKWFDPRGELQYSPSVTPDSDVIRPRLYRDNSGRAPVSFVKLPGCTSVSRAQKKYAEFIAAEIRHLLYDSHILLAEWRTGLPVPRPLRADDICVLVRSFGEFRLIEKALREATDRKGVPSPVPYTFARQGGLFQTAEATHIWYLLNGLAFPEDASRRKQASLTFFLGRGLRDILAESLVPGVNDAAVLPPIWIRLFAQNRWDSLFAALLEDAPGLPAVLEDIAGERRLANVQHILQLLHGLAVTENLDGFRLLDRLDSLRKNPGGDDANIQRLESEQPKVQIMTMHKSKGLQFPVVFIAGGFSSRPDTGAFARYSTSSGQVFDLTRGQDSVERAATLAAEEERRVFYVALTRAEYKLYVPFLGAKAEGGELSRRGGSLTDFVFSSITDACSVDQSDDAWRFIACSDPRTSAPAPAEYLHALPELETEQSSAMGFRAPERIVPGFLDRRRLTIESFTSLARSSHFEQNREILLAFGEEEISLRNDDEVSPPRSGETDDLIPPGADTGSMFHELLEKLDYGFVAGLSSSRELAGDAGFGNLVREMAARYGLVFDREKKMLFGICDLIFNAVRTPLSLFGGRLCDACCALREAVFHLPVAPVSRFLTGSIDLLCVNSERRVFIVDWKSNLLPSGYGACELECAMREHAYDLQYRIYSLALRQWLRQRREGFEFERDFGGVYYMFLRGLNGLDETGGVFCHRPASADMLDAWQRDIEKLYAEAVGR